MKTFLIVIGCFFALAAFQSIHRLGTKTFPLLREPVEAEIVAFALMIELTLCVWAWILVATAP